MLSRRRFLGSMMAGTLGLALPPVGSTQVRRPVLAMPPLLDATAAGRFHLRAQAGSSNFGGSAVTPTLGFNQAYLGPTLRLPADASTQARVSNQLDEAITVHWHGLVIPGGIDGGPHQRIAPGTDWAPEIPVSQPPTTAWYHAHGHQQTSRQVHQGLAGVLQISDGRDEQRGLPARYGVDDLTLVLQDRRFDRSGRSAYQPVMHDRMMGYLGNGMLINGQLGSVAVVPAGLVRLRLLNASNARIYTLAFNDQRAMHLVATDGGLLDSPISTNLLRIAPGERYEVLVDFADDRDVSLISGPHPSVGMMGRGVQDSGPFEILPFRVDRGIPGRITRLPTGLGGSRPDLASSAASRRQLNLDMSMGMGMMMGGGGFSINGQPFRMNRLNFAVRLNALERWQVSGDMLMHPFHVHGVRFQVLSENGAAALPQNRGWKDTLLINGVAEILLRFEQPAPTHSPYMFHCHILEHEDGGMMGQFSVT